MIVGVPTEIKVAERRVGLKPPAVRELVAADHRVIVQSGAGHGVGASDEDYQAAGAAIVPSAAEVFEQAEMVVKVKEPQAAERAMLREGQILFTYLHLAPDPDQAADLVASGAICIAYETVTGINGTLPLLRSQWARLLLSSAYSTQAICSAIARLSSSDVRPFVCRKSNHVCPSIHGISIA